MGAKNNNELMNNVDFIIKLLLKRGHDTTFGATGGGDMFLMRHLEKKKNLILFLLTTSNQRQCCRSILPMKKKAAILSITSGPGGTNAITGVIGAGDIFLVITSLLYSIKTDQLITSLIRNIAGALKVDFGTLKIYKSAKFLCYFKPYIEIIY